MRMYCCNILVDISDTTVLCATTLSLKQFIETCQLKVAHLALLKVHC